MTLASDLLTRKQMGFLDSSWNISMSILMILTTEVKTLPSNCRRHG